MLSDRIRPNVEAAPWLIEEVKDLEKKLNNSEETVNSLLLEADRLLSVAYEMGLGIEEKLRFKSWKHRTREYLKSKGLL